MKLTAPWRRRWGLNPRAVADLSHFECDPFTTWVLLQILLTCKTASDRTRIEQLKNYLYSNSECNRNRIKSRFSAARLPHCPTDFECGALDHSTTLPCIGLLQSMPSYYKAFGRFYQQEALAQLFKKLNQRLLTGFLHNSCINGRGVVKKPRSEKVSY